MKYFVALFLCFNIVSSEVRQGLHQEKRLEMREEELNLVKSIDNKVFEDGPWKSILNAAQDCNLKKVKEQIKNGTSVNIKDQKGWSAIYVAVRSSCEPELIEYLIKNDADIDAKCDEGWTALHWASYNGKVDIADILIRNGADMNLRDVNGFSSIHLSVHRGHLQMVNFLICNGVALNVKCKRGWTPLFTAAFKGNVKIAILLIQKGMDVNARDNEGWTPLHVSSYEGYSLIITLLVRKLANVNAVENDGFTSLHLAVQEGNDDAMETLLKLGSHVDPITNDGRTPLLMSVFKDRSIQQISAYSAIYKGYDEIIKNLLRHGANPNFKYVDEWSVLHEACRRGNDRIVDLLIKNGANVNVQDRSGITPLHSACKQGYGRIVELLVQHKALSYKDSNGKTPLDYATTRACKTYLKLPINRVLGGESAKPREFPWMAALGYLNENYKVSFDCAGVVISEIFIMTAAHCGRPTRPPIVVRLGKVTLTDNDTDDIKPSNFPIQEIIRHSNYSFVTKQNDIALIRVGKRINFTSEIVPACLLTNLHDKGVDIKLLATGWGTTDSKRIIISNNLQKTQLTSMPLSKCNDTLFEFNRYANSAALRNGIIEGQYCAYDPQARNDTCLGDSGGPLQYFDDNSGIATVLGIVSVGFGCGTVLPSLYTRVAYYMGWIEPIVWPTA